MFWADKVLEGRKGSEFVNDAWTPSGIVHMGGLKGPVIHDILFKIIKEQKREVKFTFGFDDMDPIDGLPPDLKESHEKYLGVPIFQAPSPDGKGTFGEYYGNKMRALFKSLGISAEIYLASEYYKKGIYNKAIKHVLDNADKVRKVYEEMYKKPIAKDWFPLQVICPNCGKLGTTKVTGWDGEKVQYECKEDLVKWAKGCLSKGKISPLNGNAKMPWKVEWAAKWWTFGVTIEGAGKDHASAGGSYDVAIKLTEDVFKSKPPLKLPYEFFLWNGKKMASSKGIGLTSEELLGVLPPEIVRFLMIKTEPNTAVEFNPYQNLIIPKLYEDYQKAAVGEERAFELSQIDKSRKPPLEASFVNLVGWVQMPNADSMVKKYKMDDWVPYTKEWVDKYAPEEMKFALQEKLPEQTKKLTDKQKDYLKKVLLETDKKWIPDEFQQNLYFWAKEKGLSSSEAFQAIYISLLGKDHGPKAGWIILENKDFVKKRFQEVQ